MQGFGGTASGFEVLKRLHDDINSILLPLAGKSLTVTAIVDIMNCIGRCIVAGDVRQTAEIAFGDPNSAEYLDLKVRNCYRIHAPISFFSLVYLNGYFSPTVNTTVMSIAHCFLFLLCFSIMSLFILVSTLDYLSCVLILLSLPSFLSRIMP